MMTEEKKRELEKPSNGEKTKVLIGAVPTSEQGAHYKTYIYGENDLEENWVKWIIRAGQVCNWVSSKWFLSIGNFILTNDNNNR